MWVFLLLVAFVRSSLVCLICCIHSPQISEKDSQAKSQTIASLQQAIEQQQETLLKMEEKVRADETLRRKLHNAILVSLPFQCHPPPPLTYSSRPPFFRS